MVPEKKTVSCCKGENCWLHKQKHQWAFEEKKTKTADHWKARFPSHIDSIKVSCNGALIPLAEESGGTRGRTALEEDWEDNLTILTTIQWSSRDRGCHYGSLADSPPKTPLIRHLGHLLWPYINRSDTFVRSSTNLRKRMPCRLRHMFSSASRTMLGWTAMCSVASQVR
jgi:hypothetical protein